MSYSNPILRRTRNFPPSGLSRNASCQIAFPPLSTSLLKPHVHSLFHCSILPPMLTFFTILIGLASTNAHIAAFEPAMYCNGGNKPGVIDQNADAPVQPLWDLPFEKWWFHHVNGCDEVPPPPGVFLDLPAGGSFKVQLATNRAFTNLSYNGKEVTEWPGGAKTQSLGGVDECITGPNLHTTNESRAAGTAFAISYESDIKKVTQGNLAIFTVLYHTPWKLEAKYEVPADMPPCPAEGCICAWTWIPNGCGEPNMYMGAHRCRVTNSKSKVPVAKAKPAVWCEEDPKSCTKGAKQLIAWHQATGNNIVVSGYDKSGLPKSPAYNMKCGFKNGAQNDIFETAKAKRELVEERSSLKRDLSLARHAEKNRIRNW